MPAAARPAAPPPSGDADVMRRLLFGGASGSAAGAPKLLAPLPGLPRREPSLSRPPPVLSPQKPTTPAPAADEPTAAMTTAAEPVAAAAACEPPPPPSQPSVPVAEPPLVPPAPASSATAVCTVAQCIDTAAAIEGEADALLQGVEELRAELALWQAGAASSLATAALQAFIDNPALIDAPAVLATVDAALAVAAAVLPAPPPPPAAVTA